MPVIAMNQEMGSLGKDVAAALAADLGLSLVRHEVVVHVADKMHVKKSLVRRVMEGKGGIVDRMTTDTASLAIYTAEEVYELAAKGNMVIRGWGATYLLRAIPHIPSIRVCAPIESRVRNLMQKLETDDQDLLREEIQRSDAAHIANMQHRFGVTWGDPMLYDLVLNTERISITSCVEQIKALLARPEFQETPASHARLANLALQAHIKAALKAGPDTADISITIDVDGSNAVLRGIVFDESEKAAAERVAKKVPGVASVENGLRLMAKSRLFTSDEKY
ncbi:MAG: cytidylate kinase family protein [Betaproteobacteria bacterium]|nr:cytidylate kinase family protein [Betaproteobacteria bacterium]